jgi:lysozyme
MNEVNVKAFMKVIRYAETGYEDDRAYYVLYGGGTFSDTSAHPLPLAEQKEGPDHKKHTPAGAYQITYRTWYDLHMSGIAQDFSKYTQDRCAIEIMKWCHVMNDLMKGDINKVLHNHMLRGQWSSLPGASQQQIDMDTAVRKFHQYVKEYSKK